MIINYHSYNYAGSYRSTNLSVTQVLIGATGQFVTVRPLQSCRRSRSFLGQHAPANPAVQQETWSFVPPVEQHLLIGESLRCRRTP